MDDEKYSEVVYNLSTRDCTKTVGVYIDGFNLYHACVALNDYKLRWLNFYSLSKSFLRPSEELSSVYFFTSVVTWDKEKQERHRNFIEAQKAVGVRIVESNFRKSRRFCDAMTRYCDRFEEKQTDVAIATTLMGDAFQGNFDRAILITADSDQVPLINQMRRLFPEKIITLSAPPGRGKMARELGNVVHERVPLEPKRLYAHCLPQDVMNDSGQIVASMPDLYKQPIGQGAI